MIVNALQSVVPLRVIVLDDDPDVALTMGEILALRGHEVLLCKDLEAAWRSIETRAPDVLVADFKIGTSNCARLLAAVQAKHAAVRLVLVSGSPQEEWMHLVESGLVQGALIKPFGAEELMTLVEG
jgi:DNA-binding NtrC family response regulator